MTKVLMIAAGGALGSVLRYAVSGLGQRLTTGAFPVGTLIVNITGCFLIGFLGVLLTGPYLIRPEYRIAILVGLLGGFTTFSTYGTETFQLINDGQKWYAMSNVVLSNVLGLAAVWIGYRLAEKMYGV